MWKLKQKRFSQLEYSKLFNNDLLKNKRHINSASAKKFIFQLVLMAQFQTNVACHLSKNPVSELMINKNYAQGVPADIAKAVHEAVRNSQKNRASDHKTNVSVRVLDTQIY